MTLCGKELPKDDLMRKIQRVVLESKVFNFGEKSYMLQETIFATYQSSKKTNKLMISVSNDFLQLFVDE